MVYPKLETKRLGPVTVNVIFLSLYRFKLIGEEGVKVAEVAIILFAEKFNNTNKQKITTLIFLITF